jgi:LPS-assembly lipoprotein
MWSFSRRAVVLGLPALLGACGFRPLYAPGGTSDAPAALAAVEITPIANRAGQELRNHLADLLDPGRLDPPPRYRLMVALDEELSEFAVARTGFATRRNLRIEAEFVLVDPAGGTTLTTGRSRITAGYDIVDSKFSTLTADEAARSRAVRGIAQDIRRQLGAHFASRPPDPE